LGPIARVIPGSHYDSLAKYETFYWWHRARLNWAEFVIRKHFANPSKLNVLDYGCGTGGFLHELNQRLRFKAYAGIDTSEQAIYHAKKYGEHYHICDNHSARFLDGRDLILLMDVLEHIEDDEFFLRRLLENAATGAKVLITVPAIQCFYSEWDKVLGHYRRYTETIITKTVEAGAGKIEWGRYCFSFIIPGLLFRKLFKRSRYDADFCEFPPVHRFTNSLLNALSKVEISAAQYFKIPVGSTFMCLIGKAQLSYGDVI